MTSTTSSLAFEEMLESEEHPLKVMTRLAFRPSFPFLHKPAKKAEEDVFQISDTATEVVRVKGKITVSF